MHTHTMETLTGSEAVDFWGKYTVGEKFTIDDPKNPRRKEIYENLYYYFGGSEKTTLNPKKGILLIGDLGVGKSILFKVMNQIFKACKYVHAKRNIERTLKEFGELQACKEYGYDFKGNLMIDDVGTEEVELYLYKNRISMIGQLLLERYDLFQDTGLKTHVSTNLTTEALSDLYGERNFDRFREMFNIIIWKGASLRL
jgi:DNA replication protein DnaC